jgi:hypothetical protein
MCKHRIETAFNDLSGLWSSGWDVTPRSSGPQMEHIRDFRTAAITKGMG